MSVDYTLWGIKVEINQVETQRSKGKDGRENREDDKSENGLLTYVPNLWRPMEV